MNDWNLGCRLPLALESPPANVTQAAAHRLDRFDIDDQERLFEPGCTGDDLALVVQHDRVPVEDELVLASDGIHERDVTDVVARASGQHLLALALLADVKRRGRDIRDQLCAREREVGRGRSRLPDVLADGGADEHVAVLEQDEVAARREIAVLVEHPVVREEALAVDRLHLAGRTNCERVVQVAVEVRRADERDDAAGRARNLLERALGSLQELGPQQKVFRRVAGHRQLGEEDDLGAGLLGVLHPTDDFLAVPVEVADRGVDLSQCEAHGFRL